MKRRVLALDLSLKTGWASLQENNDGTVELRCNPRTETSLAIPPLRITAMPGRAPSAWPTSRASNLSPSRSAIWP